MAGFLTDEWLAELARAAQGLSISPGAALVLQQVVEGDDREVAYALVLADGQMQVVGGRVDAPDLTIRLDAATAQAIHEGRLSAQVAFLDGRLRLSGDVVKLLAAAPVLSDLPDVFGPVRA